MQQSLLRRKHTEEPRPDEALVWQHWTY
jgi:hypothetical protein